MGREDSVPRKFKCVDGVLKKTALDEFIRLGGRILAVSKKHSSGEQPWKMTFQEETEFSVGIRV